VAVLIRAGAFANDGERRVATELVRSTPSPAMIVSNLFVPIVNDTLEIDLLVIGTRGIVVAEVKDWWGTVRFENGACTKDGQRRDDPRVLVSRKAKILHSLLGRLSPVPHVRIVTAPMIIFARDDTRILGDVERSTPVLTIGHAGAAIAGGHIGAYVQTTPMSNQEVLAVAQMLAGKHAERHATTVGNYTRGARIPGTPFEEYWGQEVNQQDQTVRLKRVVLDDLASHAERVEQKRFALRDAEALRSLQRLRLRELPIVYSVFEDPDDDASLWTAYEAVQGPALVDAKLAPREAVAALGVVARALGACHKAGVLHRALTADAAIPPQDGTPRILHFDHARVLGKATIAGGRAGQAIRAMPGAAPEVRADPSLASARSDIFAFGALAAQVLLGQRLEPEQEARDLVSKVRPREVGRVLWRMLEGDPRARFQDMESAAEAMVRASRSV